MPASQGRVTLQSARAVLPVAAVVLSRGQLVQAWGLGVDAVPPALQVPMAHTEQRGPAKPAAHQLHAFVGVDPAQRVRAATEQPSTGVAGQIPRLGQIQLAIQSALLLAQPTALIQLGSAAFAGADTVARALIIATQDLVDAVVSLNPAAIVQAVVTGVTGVLNSVAVAGQDVVDGIVAAQDTLATALAARPAPTPPGIPAAIPRRACPNGWPSSRPA